MADAKLCAVPGCGKRGRVTRGWCNAHYLRWYRHGAPDEGGPPKVQNGTLPVYVRDVVLPHRGPDCLIWPFGRTGSGYAAMRDDGAQGQVHRLICQAVNGPPPTPEHEAAHSCGRGHEGCVSPQHLRWATGAENQADRITHGTDLQGDRHPLAKLTAADVRAIRRDFGQLSLTELGDRHGVTKQNISYIVRRKTWSSVT